MLAEIAIGDAYGAGFEFCSKEHLKKNDGKDYHGRTTSHGSEMGYGKYTDDTQMSIGMAEFINDGILPYQKYFIKKFKEVYKRDPRPGYSRRLTNALKNSLNSRDFYQSVSPISDSNGCVMRTLPLGLLETPEKVIQYAMVHATCTHATYDGVNATVVLSLIAHYFYHKGVYEGYMDFVEQYVPYCREIIHSWTPNDKGVPVKAIPTIGAVCQVLSASATYTDILKESVNFEGDTDSVAAVALGLASLLPEFENDLNINLYNKLENGDSGYYGLDYLNELDKSIFHKYPRQPWKDQ